MHGRRPNFERARVSVYKTTGGGRIDGADKLTLVARTHSRRAGALPSSEMNQINRPAARDITRITLGVVFIGLMITASLWVLWPFVGATVWATMIVVATWPIMTGLQARLGGRRWIAVTIMTLLMLMLLVVPLVLAVSTVLEYADDIAGYSRSVATLQVPPPPEWVEKMPLIGAKLATEWRQLAATSSEELAARAAPYIRTAILGLAVQAGGFAILLLHFLLTVVITAILFSKGAELLVDDVLLFEPG